jgi:hypothetical protein
MAAIDLSLVVFIKKVILTKDNPAKEIGRGVRNVFYVILMKQ